MSPPRTNNEYEARKADDDKTDAEIRSAWRASRWLVRVILVAGAVITTAFAAFVSVKSALSGVPHP